MRLEGKQGAGGPSGYFTTHSLSLCWRCRGQRNGWMWILSARGSHWDQGARPRFRVMPLVARWEP